MPTQTITDMVMGKVRHKAEGKERVIFDTAKLRDPYVKELFRLGVSSRFQVLVTNDVEDFEERQGQFKEVYNESVKEVVGGNKRVKNDWISGHTYRKFEERRRLKEMIIRGTRSARPKHMQSRKRR